MNSCRLLAFLRLVGDLEWITSSSRSRLKECTGHKIQCASRAHCEVLCCNQGMQKGKAGLAERCRGFAHITPNTMIPVGLLILVREKCACWAEVSNQTFCALCCQT
jgi:hypothetical protein